MRGNTCYVAATLNIYTPASHRAARFVGLPRGENVSSLSSALRFLPRIIFPKIIFQDFKEEISSHEEIRIYLYGIIHVSIALKLDSLNKYAGKVLKTGYLKLALLSVHDARNKLLRK